VGWQIVDREIIDEDWYIEILRSFAAIALNDRKSLVGSVCCWIRLRDKYP
jgi:hypothetical protein